MLIFVYCLAHDEVRAERIIRELLQGGLRVVDISVLIPDQTTVQVLLTEGETSVGTGSGVPTWVAGIHHLYIPGLGSFNATGLIRAAAANGLVSTLVDLGMTECDAKRFEGKVRQGSILIAVHSVHRGCAFKAKEIFVQMTASDIGSAEEGRVNAAKAKTEPLMQTFGMTPSPGKRFHSLDC